MKAAASFPLVLTLAGVGLFSNATCSMSGSGTTMVISVYSNLTIGSEIDGVEVNVAEGELRYPFALGTGSGRVGFPIHVALVPGGKNDQHFRVEVNGFTGGRPVVSQSAMVSFVSGNKQEIVLFLNHDCQDVPCASGFTCEKGTCVSEDVAGTRRPFNGNGDASGSGGTAGLGGASGAGGDIGSGGVTGAGGAVGSGGAIGSGGSGGANAGSGGNIDSDGGHADSDGERLDASGPENAIWTFTEFTIPTTGSTPKYIAVGSDGNLWFTEWDGNQIARVTTAGIFTEYPLPTAGSSPDRIVAASDGNLWFTEWDYRIGRITTSGAITEYPTGYYGPISITDGPDGNVWFTAIKASSNISNGIVARITPAGVITQYTIPNSPASPGGIAVGADQNLWFVDENAGKVLRMTIHGEFAEFAVPGNQQLPSEIVAGPEGNLWFTVFAGEHETIDKITTSGTITVFPYPAPFDGEAHVTVGRDGNLWLTENNFEGKAGACGIVRMTTTGLSTKFDLPYGSNPGSIVSGADGALWFTEPGSNKIGRIMP